MQTEERITIELVREFVMATHGDLEKVQELLVESTPWESAFHVRRIVKILLFIY